VLRVALREPVTAIVGRTISGVSRRAHFVLFELPPLAIVVAPMLAGRFTIAAPTDRRPADLALTLELSDGRELRYRDDVQMGKVYVVDEASRAQVPGLAKIGVDVLDKKAFTKAAFRAIAKTRRDQVKVFLMDKAALDAMGNAYADEVLFEAKLHPKTFVRSLEPAEVDRLHAAIVRVLGDARAEVLRRKPPIDEKVRDFLKVRNRHGQACPRCGATIRKAGVHGHDAFFCPECQPDDRKSAIVDFRRAKRDDG
jgi:formamidopyrimidine-DNA glycosylase